MEQSLNITRIVIPVMGFQRERLQRQRHEAEVAELKRRSDVRKAQRLAEEQSQGAHQASAEFRTKGNSKFWPRMNGNILEILRTNRHASYGIEGGMVHLDVIHAGTDFERGMIQIDAYIQIEKLNTPVGSFMVNVRERLVKPIVK